AFGFEIFGNRTGDVVITQVDVAAAAFAHRGLCADRHLQLGAALEADELPQLLRTDRRSGGGLEDSLNADVLPALFAGGGVGGADVAEQFRPGFDVDLILGGNVAVDLAARDNVGGIDVAVDDRAVAQVQGAVGVDFAIQFPVKGQFAGKFDVPFDFNVRVQHVLRRSSSCVHILSPWFG